MVEWNVFVNSKYIGTVFAKSEELARLAAIAIFDLDESVEISVTRR